MFGSSWANPQQNQQQQQQTPGAFGQPSAFGGTTSNPFGTGSAFGQQPQQQNQQQAQPQVNPMFGGLTTTPSTNTNTGGFGAFSGANTANTGAFGAAKPAGGFGAFGGGTSAFGSGGTTGAFGQTATAPVQTTTSAFGQPAAPTVSNAFGASNTLFGGNKTFGATTGTTGSSFPIVTQGTSTPQYASTPEKDANVTLNYQSISCMPQYIGYSFDELRAQDYAQNRKTASASTGAFGQTAFGAAQPTTTGLFGQQQPVQQQPTSLFGGAAANTANTNTGFGAFGQATTQPAAAPTTSLFGGNTFGQTQPQQQQQPSAFGGGTGAFGQPQQPQQQQPGSIFGGGGAFGSTNTANKPAFGAFGSGATTNTFGTPATTSAFGAQPQPQPAQGTGLFGSTAANNTSAFGGGTFGAAATKPSIFGTQPAAQPNPTPFGAFGANNQQQQQQQPQQPSLFGGGGLFGGQQQQQPQQNQQQAQPSLFGGAQQTTTPSLFGNTNTGGGLFGNNQQQQQQQQGQQQATGLSSFLNKPTQPAAPSLFGGNLGQSQANAGQLQQGSLFGNSFGQSVQPNNGLFGGNKLAAPLMGNSLSGSQNMSGSLFGGNNNAGGQGTPLTASINQPIGENLPIFTMLPPGPRIVDLESTAPKKKAGFFLDMPTRSPVPRVALSGYTPANSKLRGFGSVSSLASSNGGSSSPMSFTSGRAGALSISNANGMSQSVGPDFLGRSGSPALGSGARHSVKKVILEKKIEPTELFVKSGSPGSLRTGKVTFSPALSQASREKDAALASAPQLPESPTPAPRSTQHRASNSFAGPKHKEPSAAAPEQSKSSELAEGDYWMKPDLETLKKAGYDQLSVFKDLVVGRKGYGEIRFLEIVDLTGLAKLGALLGEVVRFDDKECSVYPDSEDVDKPPPGSGLNVKAQLSLERCWAVDKATREPITDPDHPSAVKHLKRLKNMKDTHFENFDIKTGTWTFTVDHF